MFSFSRRYIPFALLGPLLSVTALPLPAEALSLDSYLEQASARSEDLRSIDLDIQSLEAEIEARDLELSAVFGLELNRFWDRRPGFSSNLQTDGSGANVSLTKPFATGTRLSLLSDTNVARFKTTPPGEQNLLNWELGISQSLWQNSFGKQTALRRRRDLYELRSRFLALMSERQRLLMSYESLYWDLVLARQEVIIREENLGRGRRILSYIQDRFGRSAAERSDMLQAQALVVGRELQLLTAIDNRATLEARLQEQFLLDPGFEPQNDALRQDRPLTSFAVNVDFAPPVPTLIDALRARALTDYEQALAGLEKDRLKPILELGYAYGQQGVDPSRSTARSEAFSSSNRFHEVGLLFTAPLSFGLISQSRRSYEWAAEAEDLRSQRYQRQSRVQWADLQRTVREKKIRVETAQRLAQLQKDKSAEERTRYQRGRTTAFQAITFELEAAESDLAVLQLLAELRRTESQARAYAYRPEAAP